jgi:hypothetical protein
LDKGAPVSQSGAGRCRFISFHMVVTYWPSAAGTSVNVFFKQKKWIKGLTGARFVTARRPDWRRAPLFRTIMNRMRYLKKNNWHGCAACRLCAAMPINADIGFSFPQWEEKQEAFKQLQKIFSKT